MDTGRTMDADRRANARRTEAAMSTATILRRLFTTTITLAVPVAFVVACAASAGTPSSPSGSPADGPHPDTMAEPGNCNYFNYYHDESKNPAGASKCATDCDCDGMRSCKAGLCDGEPRPNIDCDSPKHRWNEAWNPQGPGKCSTDCDCDGRRTCVWPPLKQRAGVAAGTCEGVAR